MQKNWRVQINSGLSNHSLTANCLSSGRVQMQKMNTFWLNFGLGLNLGLGDGLNETLSQKVK